MPLQLVPPTLAANGAVAGDPAAWAWPVKWHGWRALVYVDDGLRVRTRPAREVSASLPELGGLADALAGRSAISGPTAHGRPWHLSDEQTPSTRARPESLYGWSCPGSSGFCLQMRVSIGSCSARSLKGNPPTFKSGGSIVPARFSTGYRGSASV